MKKGSSVRTMAENGGAQRPAAPRSLKVATLHPQCLPPGVTGPRVAFPQGVLRGLVIGKLCCGGIEFCHEATWRIADTATDIEGQFRGAHKAGVAAEVCPQSASEAFIYLSWSALRHDRIAGRVRRAALRNSFLPSTCSPGGSDLPGCRRPRRTGR